jgi:hypothetical protein
MGTEEGIEQICQPNSLPDTLYDCVSYLHAQDVGFSCRDLGLLYIQCMNDLVQDAESGRPPYKKFVFPAGGTQAKLVKKKQRLFEEAVGEFFEKTVQRHWIDKVDREEILAEYEEPELPFTGHPAIKTTNFVTVESTLCDLATHYSGDQFYTVVGECLWKAMERLHDRELKRGEETKDIEYGIVLHELRAALPKE